MFLCNGLFCPHSTVLHCDSGKRMPSAAVPSHPSIDNLKCRPNQRPCQAGPDVVPPGNLGLRHLASETEGLKMLGSDQPPLYRVTVRGNMQENATTESKTRDCHRGRLGGPRMWTSMRRSNTSWGSGMLWDAETLIISPCPPGSGERATGINTLPCVTYPGISIHGGLLLL